VEHEGFSESAELFALGVLEGDELRQFEVHLASGCTFCQAKIKDSSAALDLLAFSLEPAPPPAELKTRLLERIDSDKPGLVFIHRGDGDWLEVGRGIFAKVLNRDLSRKTVTALVRMAPGSRYDDHRHTQTEELLVLEGSCYSGGRLLRKGDYHRAEPGSHHYDTRSEDGSLMLLTTALQNEKIE
jgi:quercetin dioxygenase-like cupin family protein